MSSVGADSKQKYTESSGQGTDKKMAIEENKDFQQTMMFLSKVRLFTGLPHDVYPLLAQACEPALFRKGETVIKQGDEGSEFFVIKNGEALVSVQFGEDPPQNVATLKSGDYFGEHALLRDEPRSATINANTTLHTLKIRRDKFRELELNDKLHFANRKAVGGAGVRTLVTKPPSPKSELERKLIASALRKNENLQTIVSMEEDSRINAMIDIAWKETIAAGTEVISEGDLVADYFYVVQEGCFEVYVAGKSGDRCPVSAELAMTKGGSKLVSSIAPGGSFGELALLYLEARAATVQAQVDSVVWVFDRQNFKNILMKASADTIDEYMKMLESVELLHTLLADERRAMANALVEMHFGKSETILQQGDPGSTFYILYDGEVAVIKDGHEQTRLSATARMPSSAKFFGERSLLTQEPRAATVIVTSSAAKLLALDRDSFQMLLGPLEDILSRGSQGESKVGKFSSTVKGADRGSQRIMRKDLARIGLLGCGGFGAVELVENKSTKECYAMKALSKGYIVKTGMQDSVMNEKNILLMTNSPFVIKLHETYNGEQSLYFLLEPALGGELYATYNRKGLHGSGEHAKFYVAGTILGFEHLHERRIIYRDLKPENLLLNERGQLKITDMGLAKFAIGKTYTTCGTPDYFAPELIASKGHTNALDWWTLGILIFELMSGRAPFESPSAMQTYTKVTRGIHKVEFPSKCQGVVGDIIRALLKAEPSDRLPMRPGGVQNIKSHRWYKGFDWEAFGRLEMQAPYLPRVKTKTDISNFSANNADRPKVLRYVDDGSGWDRDFATSS